MASKLQVATFIPIFFSILAVSYLGIISLIAIDPFLRKLSLSIAVGLFFGGVLMAFCWMFYWVILRAFERETA